MLFKKMRKNLFSNFLDIIFPRFCINCNKEGEYICTNCMLFLSESEFICPACQKLSYFGKKHSKCKEKNSLDGLVSFWDYEGIIKMAIHQVKHKKTFHLLEEIIEKSLFLIEKEDERFSYFISLLVNKKTYITFIPMFCEKEKERGFNQSKIIADYLSNKLEKKLIPLLKREKNTEPQINLNKKERFLNVEKSFLFISNNYKVKKVIIVGDIWVSGLTMKECCRALKQNGIEEVWGITLARVN